MKCPNCFADKQTAKQCPSCGYEETLAEQNPLYLKPQTLLNQRYLIGHVIGHGGFGITYTSWDIKLERKVAIKEFLPTALATRTSETNEGQTKYTVTAIGDQKEAFKIGLKKFLKEAKILAGFAHDNIVRVIDYFENHETGYIVMEYVGQEDLSQLVKRQPAKRLAVATALEILLPILNALKIIHANGIYHQDISLQNIRMVDGNKPVLIDFGAARYVVKEISQSVEKVFKPGYSPMEQITSNGKIGPWTDIYACGAMFYAMVVGELPPQSVDRLDRDDLIPPDQKIAISPALNEAVLKALSVGIGDRFQTAEEFATALTSPTLKAKKKKRLLAVTAGVFLVIAVATVGVVVFDPFDLNWEIQTISDSKPSSIITPLPPPSTAVDGEAPQPEENQAKVIVPDPFDHHWEIPAASDPEPPPAVTPPLSAVVDEEVPQLVLQPEENQEVQLAEKQVLGLYPEASTHQLTSAELSPLSKWQLKIMRNEIFARHGYIFKTHAMKEYFKAIPWYHPQFHDVSHLLTSIERHNIKLIQQEVQLAEEQVPGLYPEASTRQLTSADLSPLSKWQLKIMRNEIFARHGYIFKIHTMKEYFKAIPWYHPQFHDVSHLLTSIERHNIKLIQQYDE